ncbi:MAG: hybrid sensor histidine kinase/response regulator [Bradyrhizobium sp.]|nr:hybrid sensor histidine kinase/response regulator [Bradyrhizobium sp.]
MSVNGRNQKTIRYWLICLVLGCVLPATLGSAFLFTISYLQQRTILERNTIATARALMQAIDAELFGVQSALQVLAESKRLASGDLASFHRQASDALPNIGGNYIAVTDIAGRQLLNTLSPFGTPLPSETISNKVRQVFDTGKPAISDFSMALAIGLPAITLDVPVLSEGKVVYTLTIGIFADRLADILHRQNLLPDWIAAIFDSTGTVAARTHSPDQYVGGKGSASFLRAAAEGSEGVTDANSLEGIPMLSAFSRSARSGWAVGIGIPMSSLTGNLWRSLGFHAAVTLGLLALSIWMARSISIKISRSIRSLHAPAMALGTPELLSIPDYEIVEVNDVGQGLVRASHMIRERVVERERDELATQEMVVANQIAGRTSRAKSEFLASMSHELRTPLNAISGFAHLLGQPGDTLKYERRIRYTENIMEASDQLGKIIDDVLDMASFETGHVNVNCQVLDCLEVMTEVSRTLEMSAKKRGILFTIDTSGNLPSIVADRGRLIQVLLNLGSNAIKYNVDGGWALLGAVPLGDVVRFIVRDTGKGIAAERHGEVFEPFNRLGIELTQEEGTGIGLTISRRLVQAMNGKIGFESSLGQGSKFWIELPVADEVAVKAVRVPSLFAAAADTRCKILYIEDKIPNIELMRAIIEDLSNTHFIDAQTVADGLKIARSVLPDLVITDIHLPDGKGFDVLRELRSDRRTANIPVIALTADAMPANVHNMELAGFDHILTKPLKIPALMAILQATLRAA